MKSRRLANPKDPENSKEIGMKCFARLFRDAARTMSPTDTIESLNAELIVAKDGQNLLQESIIAKKISIINALEGLYLYIPCKLRLMSETQRFAPTEIQQDLIQALSLIYFIERVFSEVNPEWLAVQKGACQSMLRPLPDPMKEFMDGEAHQAADALIKSYQM